MSSDSSFRLAATADHDLMDERRQHAETKRRFESEQKHRLELSQRLRNITGSVWYKIGRALRLCP